MGQEMAQGNRCVTGAGEEGKIPTYRIIQIEEAAIHQTENDPSRGERFGERGEIEDRMLRHGPRFRFERSCAVHPMHQDLSTAANKEDSARNLAPFDRCPHNIGGFDLAFSVCHARFS
jgi:hypothetical protein